MTHRLLMPAFINQERSTRLAVGNTPESCLQVPKQARNDAENVQNGGMSSGQTTDGQAQILEYWRLLELFSPQKVPALKRLSPSSPNEQVIAWQPGEPLPWDSLRPPRNLGSTEMVWSHTVYLGVYSLADIYESLHRVFHDDADVYDERPPGRSACAGLLIDARGQLVHESPILSSALWATGRASTQGPSDSEWAEGFDRAFSSFAKTAASREEQRVEDFMKRFRDRFPDEKRVPPPPPIDGSFIKELLKIAHRCSGITGIGHLETDEIVIMSRAISTRRAEESNDMDFLNSFFLDDLRRVREQTSQGDVGEALNAYLTPDGALPLNNRIDVRRSPAVVDAVASVDHLPKGRWPSDPSHHLALSQQFAVNQALGRLSAANGMMGVNGPPGTGKTTMLRDVLAGNVVERARRLAALPRADDAFTGTDHSWDIGEKYESNVPQLRPELTGFEMVVASANNAAVENISFEIPATGAIAKQWHDTADYFADIATFLLRQDAKNQDAENTIPAWGTIAARLGNKSNRKRFRSDFWFGERDPKTRKPVEGGCLGLDETLRQRLEERDQWPTWPEAKNSFIQAEKRVDDLLSAAESAKARLEGLEPARVEVQRLEQKLQYSRFQLEQVEQSLSQCLKREREANERRGHAYAGYSQHLQAKPGFLEIVFTLGRALRPWREAMDEFSRTLLDAEDQFARIGRQSEELRTTFHARARSLTLTESELDRARTDLCRLETQSSHDERKYGSAYPGTQWTGENRELRAPWLDEKLDEARSELFLEALKLHENFMVAAGRKMRRGLRSAMAVVGGDYPAKLESEKVLAAWQLFFLAVPLVSTTFASAGRMFRDLGRESLGWLFIDEAGQSSPQYAAGTIWRSKRVIAVGDPLQLQPVVTVPNKAQGDIASTLGISGSWRPPVASVQTLADRITSHGTTLTQEGEDVWVSAPLRVHRRCDDPMFSASNHLAYEGIMVKGFKNRIDDPEKPLCFDLSDGYRIYPSFWANEPATVSGTHLQPNQITRLQNGLDHLQRMGVEPSDVIAISPFRTVADKLRTLTNQYPGLNAGTIHTAQGREAPVVFFVLGGNPDRPGARDWAAQSVNLVNVAVSRAQRRLYVIGDKAAWAKQNYFRELSRALDEHERRARISPTAQAELRPERR